MDGPPTTTFNYSGHTDKSLRPTGYQTTQEALQPGGGFTKNGPLRKISFPPLELPQDVKRP
jgi:hypothetical protein